MMWAEVVEAEARTWLGTPYAARQCLKGLGCDCGTLLHTCYSTVLKLPKMPRDYAVDWSTHNPEEIYLDFIAPFVEKVARPIFGGIGTWQFGRAYGHGGFITVKGSIIHSYGRTGGGKVLESRPSFFRVGGAPRRVKWWYPNAETLEKLKWPQ